MKKRKQIKVITKSIFNKRRRLTVKTLLQTGKFSDAQSLGIIRNKEFTKYFGETVAS